MTTVTIDATNVAVVQGQLSGPPRRRRAAVGQRARRARRDDPRRRRVEFGAGGLVRSGRARRRRCRRATPCVVVGYVRRRFFRAAAATQSRTEVVAQRVRARRRGEPQVGRALDEVAAAIVGERLTASDRPASAHGEARMSRSVSPRTTSMPVTSAAGGPTRHQATALATSVLRALEHRLDRAVGAVAHPAGESELDGVTPARLAEPHALHATAHDDAVADALGHLTARPSGRCRIAPPAQAQHSG